MQVPRIMHGIYSDVQSALGAQISRVRSARDWEDLLLADGLVDTADLPGLHVLNPPGPMLEADPHFHIFLALTILLEKVDTRRLPPDIEQEIFDASLQTSWGTLGLLAPANRILLLPPERYRPLLRAAYGFWLTLDTEGPRYTVGSVTGTPLWSIGTNLKYVMANLGVRASVLSSPLPPAGPAALLPLQGA